MLIRLMLSTVCESPLHGPHNYIDQAWERPASYSVSSVRTFFFSRETKTPLAYELMTKVTGNAKFEEDLHQALEESLPLFPVVQLKTELKFIIVKL